MKPLSVERVRAGRAHVALSLAVAALMLTGCRENEGNRPLSFEPGVFHGDKIPELTVDQRKGLQDRGALQK